MYSPKTVLLNKILFVSIIIGCFLSLLAVPLGIHQGRKIFYICSYLAALGILCELIINKKKILIRHAITCISILIFGFVNIIWVYIYKSNNHNDFSLIYTTLLQTGRMLVSASVLYLYFSIIEIKNKTIIGIIAIIIMLFIDTYACYQFYTSGNTRVELGISVSTTAAYLISISSSYILSIILTFRTKYKIHLALVFFVYSFIAIIVTQTRAAIILFPAISIIIFYYYLPKKTMLITVSVMITTLLFTGFIFKSTLITRYNEATRDISLYKDADSNSSIGARFAMAKIGIKVGMTALLGQSAEDRAHTMNNIIHSDSSLSGAKIFIYTHLHNELIDNFSLKGIFGILSLIFLYITLIFTSLSKKINIGLLSITLSVIIYGLSDVILFNKETLIIMFICISLSLITNIEKSKNKL